MSGVRQTGKSTQVRGQTETDSNFHNGYSCTHWSKAKDINTCQLEKLMQFVWEVDVKKLKSNLFLRLLYV